MDQINSLKFTSTTNRKAIPVLDQSQSVYILCELIPTSSISNIRLPINFCLVLDRSGSMAGEKLHILKDSVKSIIDQLGDQDILSIVTFESRTEILVEAQGVANKKSLMQSVDRIREGGGTNFAPALRSALQMVEKNLSQNALNRIILLTDGEATDRQQDSLQLADEAGARGIPIVALGFGQDWNEEFLFEIADRSIQAHPGSQIGMADYIPSPAEANKIFQEVYTSMQVVAQNVKITIRVVQGVEARRAWQVIPIIRDLGSSVIDGRSIQIPVTELERGGAAFLLEVMIPPRPEGSVRIAQSEVNYKLPESGSQRQSVDTIVQFTNEPTLTKESNNHVMNVVEKVQAFKLQTQALADAQTGLIDSATRKLRQAVTILLAQGEEDLANQMSREADQLEHSGQVSNDGKKTILLTSRKTVRLSE